MASTKYHHHHHRYFRMWKSFSTASFRRKLIATVSCGGVCSTSSSSSSNNSKSSEVPPRWDGEKVEYPHSSTSSKPNKKPNIKPGPNNRDEPGRVGPGKLSDLLNLSEFSPEKEKVAAVVMVETMVVVEDAAEVRRKEERLKELRESVKMVESVKTEERENGAKRVRMMAKDDTEARSTLAMLGVIPPLISMINHLDADDDDDDGDGLESQVEALYALLNLGIGNDLNKGAIVQAGAVHKMLKKIGTSNNGSLESSVSEAIVANFLALSALDSNKPIIGASGAIPFLVNILLLESDADKQCSSQAKHDALRALYNLSISPSNVALILDTDLIRFLINALGNMEVSERILSILSNVVSTREGRKSISRVPDAFPVLIDVLNWTDSPGCQEKGSYVLMVMAHKSYTDRQTMIEAGIGSALLELTLLGSTLAQKRASRILECLRVGKGKQISQCFNGSSTTSAAVSAPICGPSSSSTSNNASKEEEETMMSEEKKAVKQLVQQSLHYNMKRIVKRANLPQDFVPSEHLKSLTITSKSLPF